MKFHKTVILLMSLALSLTLHGQDKKEESPGGFLIKYSLELPINVKPGDQLQFETRGKIKQSHDTFYPHGMSDAMLRRYRKKHQDHSYAKLMLSIGDQIYPIGRGKKITVKNAGPITLFINTLEPKHEFSGAFEVWVSKNGQAVEVPKPKGYICELENQTPLFVPIGFSPDLSLIIGTNQQNQICVWQTSSGKRLQTYEGHNEQIICHAFLEEEPILVSVALNGKLKYWDIVSGKLLKSIQLAKEAIRNVSIDKNRQNLAFILDSNRDYMRPSKNESRKKIYLLDLYQSLRSKENIPPKELSAHQHGVNFITFSSIDNQLLTGDQKGNLNVWDTKRWEVTMSTQFKHEIIEQVIFDRSTYTLWLKTIKLELLPPELGGDRDYIRVENQRFFDFSDGTQKQSSKERPNPKSFPNFSNKTGDTFIKFSPQFEYLLIYNRYQKIQLWKVEDYQAQ